MLLSAMYIIYVHIIIHIQYTLCQLCNAMLLGRMTGASPLDSLLSGMRKTIALHSVFLLMSSGHFEDMTS